MQFVFDRQELLTKFEAAASIVNRSHVKDVLQNVLLDLDKGGIEGTDGETSVQVGIKVEDYWRGSVLLNPARFGAIIRESKSPTVGLSVDERKLHVELQNGSFSLPTSNPDEFPRMKVAITDPAIMKAGQLAQAINSTKFSVDTESTRYQLAGVALQFGPNGVNVVATNGRTLAYTALPGECKLQSAIVPVKPLALVERMASGKLGDCEIQIVGNQIAFRCSETTIFTSQIEGRFPAWEKIVPSVLGERVAVSAGALLQAIRQASVVSDDETRATELHFQEDQLSVKSSAAEKGVSSVSIPVESVLTETVIIDHKYAQDWLKTLDNDAVVELFITSRTNPVVFRCGVSTYVVMPMDRS
jgi:DNA polymerase-3 subunit beta